MGGDGAGLLCAGLGVGVVAEEKFVSSPAAEPAGTSTGDGGNGKKGETSGFRGKYEKEGDGALRGEGATGPACAFDASSLELFTLGGFVDVVSGSGDAEGEEDFAADAKILARARGAAANDAVGANGAGDQPLIHGGAGRAEFGVAEGFADKVGVSSTADAVALKALEGGRHFWG